MIYKVNINKLKFKFKSYNKSIIIIFYSKN